MSVDMTKAERELEMTKLCEARIAKRVDVAMEVLSLWYNGTSAIEGDEWKYSREIGQELLTAAEVVVLEFLKEPKESDSKESESKESASKESDAKESDAKESDAKESDNAVQE